VSLSLDQTHGFDILRLIMNQAKSVTPLCHYPARPAVASSDARDNGRKIMLQEIGTSLRSDPGHAHRTANVPRSGSSYVPHMASHL
jgi:hypothetical protein